MKIMPYHITVASLLSMLFLFTSAFCQSKVDPVFREAQEKHEAGDYVTAITLFSKCLVDEPANKDAYVARAGSKEQLRDYAGALTDYSIAIELAPENYDARLGRANILYKLGRYKEAKEDYIRLLSLDTGETNTVYFQKSASAAGTMQITTAQSNFNHLVYNSLGMVEYNLENHQEAKKWLDQAIALNSNEANYYANRALVRRAMGDQDFRDDFEKALKLNPDHTAALTGLASASSGSEADAYLDQAIASDSTKVHPILERAYQRMERGLYKEALADYNYALSLESGDHEIWLNRGFVKEKLGDINGAYSDYSKALQLKETYAEAWLNRGNASLKLKKTENALEDYTAAISFAPDYGSAYYNRAITYERLRKKSEACSDLLKAEQLGVKIQSELKESVCP